MRGGQILLAVNGACSPVVRDQPPPSGCPGRDVSLVDERLSITAVSEDWPVKPSGPTFFDRKVAVHSAVKSYLCSCCPSLASHELRRLFAFKISCAA